MIQYNNTYNTPSIGLFMNGDESMLELKNVTKKYEIGTFKQTALDGINLNFRNQEFVAVIGPSGSGKTTLLNMIGGLDRYDDGDLKIDGKSTNAFTNHDWDSYRNHAIGFVFQSYNLIMHMSVLANVELGMTLSGVSSKDRKDRAIHVLDRVGLKDHIHKKPNQLSGGQMQRVAIARALVNNPDIILADEPTGAIDSETSKQIMHLIQDIAKDKLVIMVTHDQSIAKKYASRIVDLKDGKVTGDTLPYQVDAKNNGKLNFKKTSMAFIQALKLSLSNLRTKKFRTAITAFAGSIGIIGVALILSLANGLNNEIDTLERSTLAEFPIQIDAVAFNVDVFREQGGGPPARVEGDIYEAFPDDALIYPYQVPPFQAEHRNDLSESYLNHLDGLDDDTYHEMTFRYAVNMHLYHELSSGSIERLNTSRVNFSPGLSDAQFYQDNYDTLAGQAPENENELLLVVDEYNRLNASIVNAFGLSTQVDAYDFDQFIGKSFELIMLDDRYTYNEDTERFIPINDGDVLMTQPNNKTLTITGIARIKEDAIGTFLTPGLKFFPTLIDTVLTDASESDIGQAQRDADIDVVSGTPIDPQVKAQQLRNWGVDATPSQILIYPVNYDAKVAITSYLDTYNENLDEDDRVIYTDLAGIITELTSDVIDGISYVLIAFSSISLIVSTVMIGIITYISVLERTKEIGVLRSLGARKKDISRVFNAETTIIGFLAGSSGVFIAFILTFPINAIIKRLVNDVGNLAIMPLSAVFGLIVLSIILTYLAGLIPARMASNKNPVDALRVE